MKWYSINDAYPDDKEIVLAWDKYKDIVTLARFIEEENNDYCFGVMNIDNIECDYTVTHWAPLPHPRDTMVQM